MKITTTKLPGVTIIEPQVFGDSRGFFFESYSFDKYRQEAGIEIPFVQDNFSHSERGVLRGLHFQKKHPQGKLVSVIQGAVYDVAVDIDPKSASFGQYVGVELSADNHLQLYVPPGYAHGFCVLSDTVDFIYKCTDYYHPEDEGGLAWNCPDISIDWPITAPLLSVKDQKNLTLKEMFN
jgi:dTDP-4-dehydrorhamnose 3,5-epimerase